MTSGRILVLITLCLCNLFYTVDGACETEEDLDFESCNLKDLKDDVLKEICNRMGLDMESQVLPFLYDEEYEYLDEYGYTTTRTYSHDDFVKGAEECLEIYDEMEHLEEEDPEYLAQLEREALLEDPETVAEIISDVLKQDDALLKEIAAKLEKDAPETIKEMEGMLGEGEKLEGRPDVVGFVIAKLLSEDKNLDLLDEFDEALSEYYLDDWDDWEEGDEVGDGDEL